MMPLEFDIILLALTIWGEARGETLAGKIAIANVVANRMKRLKCRVSQVVLAPFQFSFWNTEDPSRSQISNIDYQGQIFGDCLAAAKSGLSDDPDPTNNAEFYMNVDLVRRQRGGTLPGWWRSDTDSDSEIKIGNHTFRKRKV